MHRLLQFDRKFWAGASRFDVNASTRRRGPGIAPDTRSEPEALVVALLTLTAVFTTLVIAVVIGSSVVFWLLPVGK